MTAAAAPAPSGTARALFWGALVLIGLGLLAFTVVQGRGWWQDRTLAQAGRVVTAQVVSAGQAPGVRSLGQRYGLTYRLPASADPTAAERPAAVRHATVSEATYRAAQASGQVQVRVLPGQPDVQQVVGGVGRGGGLVWLLLLDLAYLGFVAALLRGGLSA